MEDSSFLTRQRKVALLIRDIIDQSDKFLCKRDISMRLRYNFSLPVYGEELRQCLDLLCEMYDIVVIHKCEEKYYKRKGKSLKWKENEIP